MASGIGAARALPRVFGIGGPATAPVGPGSGVRTIPTAMMGGARAGAAGGALAGFGSGEGGLENRMAGAAQGGLLGGAFGAAVPPVTRAVGSVFGTIGNALGWRNPTTAAMGQLLRAMERDGITLDDATRRIDEWQRTGARPETLLDLFGENVRNLANRLVNVPGASRVAGREALETRTQGQAERVLDDVRQLGRGGTGGQYYPELEALDQARRTTAAPLYERAYAADFVPNDAITSILQTPAGRAAARRARTIAMNERRDPNALGLNVNEAGDVVFERAPSMQTLDYIKRGLDDVIEQFRDPVTNRLRLDEGGRAINNLRSQFVAELRTQNPVYGEALDAWAGPSRMRDAMELGRDIFSRDAELSATVVRRMPDSEREAFRLGAVRAITDRISNTVDGRSVVARFFATPGQRQRLEAAFDNPEDFARFRTAMEREANMVQINRFMDPRAGSPTARLLTEEADQAIDVPGAMTSLLMGETRPAIRGAVAGTMNRMQGIGSQNADVLAPLLFQTTPSGNRTALGLLQAEQARRAFAQRQIENRLRGGGAGAAGGATSDVPPLLPFYPQGR